MLEAKKESILIFFEFFISTWRGNYLSRNVGNFQLGQVWNFAKETKQFEKFLLQALTELSFLAKFQTMFDFSRRFEINIPFFRRKLNFFIKNFRENLNRKSKGIFTLPATDFPSIISNTFIVLTASLSCLQFTSISMFNFRDIKFCFLSYTFFNKLQIHSIFFQHFFNCYLFYE